MTGEGDHGAASGGATTAPPLVDGEVILQAGVLGLTYLVPVLVLRGCLRVLHGMRGRVRWSRPVLAAAVIELKGRG